MQLQYLIVILHIIGIDQGGHRTDTWIACISKKQYTEEEEEGAIGTVVITTVIMEILRWWRIYWRPIMNVLGKFIQYI